MMKTSKSPENAEVTPSKKKLKQARLPFKPKSDVSPAPVVPQTRKRKLSASEDESVTKVGKICKENVSEDTVIISDDDSKPIEKDKKDEKALNPYVKLVNTAWKKKQKAKRHGKKKVSKVPNGSVETEHDSATDSVNDKEPDCDMMDVDEPVQEVSDLKNSIEKQQEADKSNNAKDVSEIVVLEDSNNSDDVQTKETIENTNVSINIANMDSVEINKAPESPENNNESVTKQKDEESDSSSSQKDLESPKKNDNDKPHLLERKVDSSPTNTPVTPKRSARNKAKAEQNNNMNSSQSSKLNDSTTSNPTTPKTPKHSRSSSVTNSQGDVSLNESTTSANLTPKQLQKKLESAKKKEEREKEKQDRDKKKQQEKEERAKTRQEKEEQRKKEKEEKEEAKKKEKEEKDEQKKKEREEKEKLKEIEKKQREEKEEQKKKEREEKEEQKRKEKEAKEEEKRKKQEALDLEKQEAELKKKKAAEALSKFLVPKQKSEKDQATINSVSKNSMLSNFTIKADMRLAPLIRANLDNDKRQELDNSLKEQDVSKSSLYLKSLKDGTSKPLGSGKTWPMSDKDDDVIIVEDELQPIYYSAGVILNCQPAREKLRPKLLSFHENRRPPYWGTWRKRSASVKPRRPFGQDKRHVDYDGDSDEEWEEEQEGESLDGSAAGSDDDHDADEYEVDNDVFVPHGYLSDEEATMDEDDVLSLSPETQKARLKHLEDEFESEMKKPTEKLQPRMYGLLWETIDGGKPENCVDALWNYFGKLSMIMNDPTPFLQPSNEPDETEKKKVKKKKVVEGEQRSPKVDKKKTPRPEDKEGKMPKAEAKKNASESKKNQPGINKFLTKLKS